MPLKSTQTNKYETSCMVMESPTNSELEHNGWKFYEGRVGVWCEFDATLWSFDTYNRMRRRYDINNAQQVINTDERIQDLKARNKWRGELNHPNPWIKGEQYSDIRMTIPEPENSSHFISKDRFEGSRYRAHIKTHPTSEPGRIATGEIVDQGVVPSFSVRLLGSMIPNASMNMPNMRVTKVITFDMVDFPSHKEADGDITPEQYQEAANVVFLKDLARYCVEQDENMSVVCESFEISPNEIVGIHDGSIEVVQPDAKIFIPLEGQIRREAFSFLMNGGR